MSKLSSLTPVAALLALSMGGMTLAHADLSMSTQVEASSKTMDAKCGEAKCGADKMSKAHVDASGKTMDAKCGEAKCGADKKGM